MISSWTGLLLIALLAACGVGCSSGPPEVVAPPFDAGSDDVQSGEAGDAPAKADAQVDDTCVFARDSTCDEPVNCALGTDSTDCLTACDAGTLPHITAAACAHRFPVQLPVDSSIGSGGTVHLTGHRDGTIGVASGEDLSTTVHRQYRLFVPASYNPAVPTPLVINMAGHRVDNYVLSDFTQLQRTADMNRFIVVYAEQEFRSDNRWAWWTDWDWEALSDQNPTSTFSASWSTRCSRSTTSTRPECSPRGIPVGLRWPSSPRWRCLISSLAPVSSPASPSSTTTNACRPTAGQRSHSCSSTACSTAMFGIDNDLDNSSIEASDAIVARLLAKGWTDSDLLYFRLENVAHRWQPQLNQQWWNFLSARPMFGKAQP